VIKIKAAAFLILAFCITCSAQTTLQEWQVIAVRKYPDLGVNGSAFNKRFVEAYTERHKTDPAFFTNPQWPLLLANELAAQPGQAASPQEQPTPPAAQSTPSPATVSATPPPGKPAANPHSEYEAVSIPKTAGLEAARFRWWAPADIQVRGVLMLISGRGGDGRGMADDPKWQALATQLQFGIMGCMFQNPKDDTGTYQGDPNGVVSDILNKALDVELTQNGQTIKNPPLVFWGHSAGGNVTQQYLGRHANRVLAAVLVRATDGPGNLAQGKGDVPVMIFVGKKDKPEWVAASLANYEKGHAARAAWTLALNPNEGHEIGKTQPVAFAHIAAAVALRLPPKTFSTEAAKPKQIDKEAGWLGDTETLEIAEYNQFKGKKKDATWLLNESVAKAWQEYLRGS